MTRRIRLITETLARPAALDTAVSRALLQQVGDGTEPETLRLHRPTRITAFGPQDLRAPGYAKAVHVSIAGGFVPVARLAGGRAAVFHEDTIAFSWAIPIKDPREDIHGRFQELAGLMQAAFLRLGVDARVGEVMGEYCPGAYSVNARGAVKLMGVGQRLIGKAAHVGGVVVVAGSEHVRNILVPVYEALDLAWDPATAGSLADEIPGTTYADAQQAVIDSFAGSYGLYEGTLSAETLALAESFAPDHAVDLTALAS
ncbi:MAG: hypothetical protein WD645_03455 [Dehalococcoidia bacterium]